LITLLKRVGNHHRMGSVQSSEKSGEGQGQKKPLKEFGMW